MTKKLAVIAVVALFAVGASMAPASAGLLNNLNKTVDKVVDKVVDTVDETVDKTTDAVDDTLGTDTKSVVNKVVTINDPNTGLVNLDTDNGTIATATVGPGGAPLVDARIGGLTGSNSVTLNLGGLGLDLDVVIGPPNPNNPNAPTTRGPILVASLGGDTFVVVCAVDNAKTLLQVAAQGKVTASEVKAWQRAANVQVIPIELCPDARAVIAKLLGKSQKIQLLQRAVTMDNLIMASLSRTKYDAQDVVAVQRRSGQLVVYVY
jgi:hypothetical protein